MARTSLLVRSGLWRVTRHAAVRRLADRLADAGIFVAQLDRFERAAGDTTPQYPHDVRLDVVPADTWVPDRLAAAPLSPDDVLVRAERDGEVVGYCCLSNRPVYVPELDRRVAFSGAYLWRLFVVPAERERGIGTAVIGRAVAAAADELGAERISALVAPDNLPSRAAFRGLGFRPTERFSSAAIGGWERHRHRHLTPSA